MITHNTIIALELTAANVVVSDMTGSPKSQQF